MHTIKMKMEPLPASAGPKPAPFLQVIKKIVLLIATVELLLSCQTERRKPSEPPSVPAVEASAPAPARHAAIKAGDPMLNGLGVDGEGPWIANDGPDRKFAPQVGKVSYYYQPQKMADGNHFDPNDLTAAHKTLPLGSIVRCTNLENGKSVIVIIKDRGPYTEGRILDLSRAAARRIGLTRDGVERCRVEVLAYPEKERNESGK